MRIQSKVTLFFGGLFVLIAMQGLFFISHERQVLRREMSGTAVILAENTAELSREFIVGYQFDRLSSQIATIIDSAAASRISIVNENGLVLADTRKDYEGWIFSGPPAAQTVVEQGRDTLTVRAPIYILGTLRGNVEMIFPLDELNSKLRENILVFSLFILFEMAAAVLFVLLIERQLVRPLQELTNTVTKIGTGAFDEPYRSIPSASVEIRRVSEAVETMKRNLHEAQQEVIAKTRMATMGTIAASFAHEIRNPLEAISGSVEVLSYDISEGNPAGEYIAIIREEIKNLNGYLENFLEFSKPRPVTRIETDIGILIDDTLLLLRPLCQKRRITCTRVLPEHPPLLYCDPWLIRRVCMNLLLNSIESFEPFSGGENRLRTEQGNRISVTVEETDSGMLSIRIEDNGCGIDRELLQHIFEPYFTTKTAGSGIGLAISRQIAEQHGGSLTILSPVPGGDGGRAGTAATITLPLSADDGENSDETHSGS